MVDAALQKLERFQSCGKLLVRRGGGFVVDPCSRVSYFTVGIGFRTALLCEVAMTLLPPHLIAAAEDVAGITRGHWITDRGSNPPRDPVVQAAACRLLGIQDLRQYRPYRETARYVVRLADRSRLEVSSEVHALVRLARHGLSGNAPGEVREMLERLRQRGGERAVKAVQAAVRQALWAVARPAAEVEMLLGSSGRTSGASGVLGSAGVGR